MPARSKATLQDSSKCRAKQLSCDNGNILGLGQSEELDRQQVTVGLISLDRNRLVLSMVAGTFHGISRHLTVWYAASTVRASISLGTFDIIRGAKVTRDSAQELL
jgi:hypothetical protein